MTCWASTSSAPMPAAGRRPARSRPPPRARPGTPASRSGWPARAGRGEGSSSRWLARPIRCTMRDGALGRGELDDQVDVAPVDAEVERRGADHARAARPRAIAASTLRRCSAASEPWCRAIGRLSSFSRHSSWKANSAWQAGVDEDQRGRVLARWRRRSPAWRAGRCGRPSGRRRPDSRMSMSRRRRPERSPAPPSAAAVAPAALRHEVARRSSGSRTVAERPTDDSPGASR